MSLSRTLKLLVSVRRWTSRAIIAAAFVFLTWADVTVAQTWSTQIRSVDYPTAEGVVVAHRTATWPAHAMRPRRNRRPLRLACRNLV